MLSDAPIENSKNFLPHHWNLNMTPNEKTTLMDLNVTHAFVVSCVFYFFYFYFFHTLNVLILYCFFLKILHFLVLKNAMNAYFLPIYFAKNVNLHFDQIRVDQYFDHNLRYQSAVNVIF